MRVYIADDSPAVRSRLVKLLAEQKEVEVVGQSGEVSEAWNAIRQLKPEVVILALHIHGGSGLELLKVICSQQPETKVVVLTNSAYQQYRETCMQLGASYFLDKSNEFDKVTSVIEQLAQRADRRPMAYKHYTACLPSQPYRQIR